MAKGKVLPRAAAKRWKRRSLFTGIPALLGLGTGLLTAWTQHSLAMNARTGRTGLVSAAGAPRGVERLLTFSGHQQTVRTVGWSPDGSMLASGADDAQLLVWLPDGTIQQRIPHSAPVESLAWSPESQRLVSGSANQVTFLAALSGTMLARTSQHTATVSSVAWTPVHQMQVVSGGFDKRAIIWETTQYRPQRVFTGHNAPIESVSWGSDGQTVASASQGGVVRVWSASTAQEIHGFYQDAQVPMRACAFAPAGTTLVVGGGDGIIRVWNGFFCQKQRVSKGGVMCQDTPLRLRASNKAIRSLAWSPDGLYLASGSDDGSFSLWSLTGGSPLFTMIIQAGSAVRSIAWAANGRELATASGNTVMLWTLR